MKRKTSYARFFVFNLLMFGLIACTGPRDRDMETRARDYADREYRDDVAITKEVALRLAEEEFLGRVSIHVATSGGAVWLKGYVERDEDRELAYDVAESVPGVRTVINGICGLHEEPECGPEAVIRPEGLASVDRLWEI